ncbi:HEAT repeat-containing protein 6 [Liparis tanakae]|uniref:HEAT repeat-containing protein 6 n=1 Tax=Liparis tanakae TaxID=230148 RepID=A0A4Z2E9I9_9TELE|nr:HEAT repeat-containing protein 6 [Liparis tanakae]
MSWIKTFLISDSLFLADSAPWASDAFSSLCHVVSSCKNFKVRIKSAAALAIPADRGCYGDSERFGRVWRSLATALENSEDTNDFFEYRYSDSLRLTLSHALLHLLAVSRSQDMPALEASLAGDEGRSIKEHLIKYLRAEEGGEGGGGGGGGEGAEGEKEAGGDSVTPQQRVAGLQQTLVRLKELEAEGEGREEEERSKETVVGFLQDLLQICKEA